MLQTYREEFAKYKKLGTSAIAQMTVAELNAIAVVETNSIAMIVRHLHGNLHSRFTNFLTTDGEKEWRNRAAEFAAHNYSRAEVETFWHEAWSHLESALAELGEKDLQQTVFIKGQAMTADAALCRAVAHVAYHVGQIVLLGRIAKVEKWEDLSSR